MPLSLKGTIQLGGGSGCVSSCDSAGSLGASDQSIMSLFGSSCAGSKVYQSTIQASVSLNTVGIPGTNFVAVDALDQLSAVEFLWIRCEQRCVVRIGATSPSSKTANLFPVTVSAADTLAISYATPSGTVATSTSFAVGSYTAAQCVGLINASAALNGLPSPRAVVDSSGAIVLTGVGTGFASSLSISGGMASLLTFAPLSANGAGSDIPVQGTFLCEFGSFGAVPGVPSSIQLSGTGTVSVIAAGRSA